MDENTDFFAQVPKAFNYAAFIEELVPLVEHARKFETKDRHHNSDAFRAWRHKLDDLITNINRLRYDVNCKIAARRFFVATYSSVSAREQQECFERDLKDTLVELDHLIDWYKKYGDPKQDKTRAGQGLIEAKLGANPAAALAPPEPEWPQKEKLTLYWLFKHMPFSAWVAVALFVVGAFTFGITVGNWTSVQTILAKWAEPTPVKAAPVPEPAKPAIK